MTKKTIQRCQCGKFELVKNPKKRGTWRRHVEYVERGKGIEHKLESCLPFDWS
jgi:hypothetical protein